MGHFGFHFGMQWFYDFPSQSFNFYLNHSSSASATTSSAAASASPKPSAVPADCYVLNQIEAFKDMNKDNKTCCYNSAYNKIGLQCDQYQKIVGIELNGLNSIQPFNMRYLPPELGNLTHLSNMYLYKNVNVKDE